MAPQLSFWLLLVAVVHSLVFPAAVNAELAFVRPNSSMSCASPEQRPCLTFNEYAEQVDQYFVDNTIFLFLPGTHELDAPLDLKDLSNVSFAPLNDLDAQILLSPSANITWTNCEDIEINGFVFILSGQLKFLSESGAFNLVSTELIFQGTTAFLTNLTLIGNGTRRFALCNYSDIQIGDLEAIGTKATLIAATYSSVASYGQILFDGLMFNDASDYGDFVMGLFACHYNFSGNISFVNSTLVAAIETYQAFSFSDSNIISGNVSFVNNTFKEGIALAICFTNNSTNIISGNMLFVNNALPQGGSLIELYYGAICYISGNISFLQNYIYYTDSESFDFDSGAPILIFSNSTIFISGVAIFVRNRAVAQGKDTPGGAIYAIDQSRVIFEETSNVSFIENSAASYGGAIYMIHSNLIMNGRVLFESNFAGIGGGALAVNNPQPTDDDTLSISNSVINCSGKSIIFRNNTSHGSSGAIYARNQYLVSNITVGLKDVRFERNTATLDGGASYSFNSVIYMTGTMDFNQNSAQRGGAMVFSGDYFSRLRLISPLTANFMKNSAILSGGVIFFQDNPSFGQICFSSFNAQQECFIELYSTANIRLNFDNNNAITGKIFYGGYLDACTPGTYYFYGERMLDIITSISNVRVNVSNPKEDVSNVSSDPIQVCICKSGRRICNSTEMVTIRGKVFTLQAVVVGIGGTPIFRSAVRISLDGGTLVSAAQRVQPIGNGCTDISYGLLAENDTNITLFPDNGACRDYGIARTIVSITFLPCPNGFELDDYKIECVCDERLQHFNALCNVNDNSIRRTSTSNRFWLGALYENDSNESTYQGLILHSGCPFDFCVDYPVPITLDNLDIQCNHNHSGTLCGSCKEGYSIALGNLHCLPCSNDYLALILPFALAGIALVALLLLLRLTVSAGTINGLIFYANIVQANTSFFFPAGESNILTVFIAWLNLDLGMETCFYDGMTMYTYAWLQFVFPFYVWFLIGLIIVATHYSIKLTKIFGRNPVTALATLFLLSYSKLHRAIIGTLSFAVLEYPDNNYKNVWFFNGDMAYGSDEHTILVIFAILVLVFLFIPYTLLVFFAQWLQALSHWRIFSWLNKIKPFIDTYHTPYKKQTRYWTGLLLFVRLFLFAFDAINSELIPVVITSITVVLTSLAWMHNMGIYENYFNNILEAFFIANLCMFAAATYYVQTNDLSRAITTNIFVGLAFAVFVCILLFHVYLVLRETAVWKKILEPNAKNYKEENEDQPPRERSPLLPTKSTVELHEPLQD